MRILAKDALRQTRKERNLTLIDLAYVARISENQMSRIERRTRPIDDKQADRILKYYGKNFDELFTIEG